VLEVIKTVHSLTGTKYIITYAKKPRLGECVKMIASVHKAKNVLEWVPKRKINDSIVSLMSWYKVHPNGWEY
jgi:UDP-glucose 4-epimerase